MAVESRWTPSRKAREIPRVSTRFNLDVEMYLCALTGDETAEPVSRDQISHLSGANRRRGNLIFPVQLTTSRIGNHIQLAPTLLCVVTVHSFCRYHIHTRVCVRRLCRRDHHVQQIGLIVLFVITYGRWTSTC